MLRHACSAWDAWAGSSNPIASSGRTPVAAAIVLHRFMPVMQRQAPTNVRSQISFCFRNTEAKKRGQAMRRVTSALVVSTLVALCLAIFAAAPNVPSNTWAPTGDMSQARAGGAATLLRDGRVLVTGGLDENGVATASVERYGPASGSFVGTPSMQMARANHTSTLLPDGRVLVAGGVDASGIAVSSAEIYDPQANTWVASPPMYRARSGQTAIALYDGRVVIAGGNDGSVSLDSIEVYDQVTGVFTLSNASLSAARTGHAASLLYNGKVFIAGGFDGANVLKSVDIYDPWADAVAAAARLATARAGHSATTLLTGKVLIAGGAGSASELGSAEVYDPTSNTFTATGNALASPRQHHQAILLPENNQVLIVGGTAGGHAVSTAEVYVAWNGSNGTFFPTNTPSTARAWASAAALSFREELTVRTGPNDGLVLLTGGSASSDATSPCKGSELYGFATIVTDRADYAPGTTVTITGSGWVPGETVTLTLEEVPMLDVHALQPVTADASGNIISTEFVPDTTDLGVRFYLTAAGSDSQAQTSFKDGNAVDGGGTMAVSTNPANTVAGSTGNALTFTVAAAPGKDFQSGSQVTIEVPAGWTAPQKGTSGNPGFILLGSATCTGVSIGTITGSGPWTIPVSMTCAAGQQFILTYGGGAGATKVIAPSTAATYTFTTKTKQSGGTLTNIVTGSPTVTVNPPTTISSVTPPGNGTYRAGQNLDFTVNYSASVTVTGTPTIGLTIGSTARNASYVSGSGTTALVFRYTVQAGDTDTDGIASASPIVLNAGTIKDGSARDAGLTFTPPSTIAVLVDTTAPSVTSINRVSANPTSAGSVSFTVIYSESVTGVDSTDFALNSTGVTGASITSVIGSGTTYTVAVNSGSGDGTIGLNLVDNDSIVDTAGNPLGGTGAGNGNFTGQLYTVDKTAPSVVSINRAGSNPTNGASASWTG